MFQPSLEDFKKKAKQGNLIPVYREILADMETPVSAFRKIDDKRTSFLLESMEGGEKWARYSFLGSRPSVIVKSFGRTAEVITDWLTAHPGVQVICRDRASAYAEGAAAGAPDAVQAGDRWQCAMRRLVVSPAQPGGTRREVLGSAGLPGSER